MSFKYISVEKKNAIATVWLFRPDVHNAFNETMIIEMTSAFEDISQDDSIRMVVLKGKGKSFCAGADINWMKGAINYTYVQNLDESLNLSHLLFDIYNCPKPTLAIVHGNIFGGGNGILAACDFVYAMEGSVFSLSEVKLGLIPACISPYIVKRVGEIKAKQLMIRGNRFSPTKACELGLIDFYGGEKHLEEVWRELTSDLATSAPGAIAETKKLLHDVVEHWSLTEARRKTAERIAEVRASDEAQEGMKAFFDKKKPNWTN